MDRCHGGDPEWRLFAGALARSPDVALPSPAGADGFGEGLGRGQLGEIGLSALGTDGDKALEPRGPVEPQRSAELSVEPKQVLAPGGEHRGIEVKDGAARLGHEDRDLKLAESMVADLDYEGMMMSNAVVAPLGLYGELGPVVVLGGGDLRGVEHAHREQPSALAALLSQANGCLVAQGVSEKRGDVRRLAAEQLGHVSRRRSMVVIPQHPSVTVGDEAELAGAGFGQRRARIDQLDVAILFELGSDFGVELPEYADLELGRSVAQHATAAELGEGEYGAGRVAHGLGAVVFAALDDEDAHAGLGLGIVDCDAGACGDPKAPPRVDIEALDRVGLGGGGGLSLDEQVACTCAGVDGEESALARSVDPRMLAGDPGENLGPQLAPDATLEIGLRERAQDRRKGLGQLPHHLASGAPTFSGQLLSHARGEYEGGGLGLGARCGSGERQLSVPNCALGGEVWLNHLVRCAHLDELIGFYVAWPTLGVRRSWIAGGPRGVTAVEDEGHVGAARGDPSECGVELSIADFVAAICPKVDGQQTLTCVVSLVVTFGPIHAPEAVARVVKDHAVARFDDALELGQSRTDVGRRRRSIDGEWEVCVLVRRGEHPRRGPTRVEVWEESVVDGDDVVSAATQLVPLVGVSVDGNEQEVCAWCGHETTGCRLLHLLGPLVRALLVIAWAGQGELALD
nr:hypothetical protein [Plesiocystis pacifica]